MALGLALANASHYYGALILFPIAGAELVRTSERGWRWRPWIAMAVCLLPYLVLIDFYKVLLSYQIGFPSRATLVVFQRFWELEVGQFTMRIFPLFLLVSLTSLWQARSRAQERNSEPFPFARHEMVGIVLFCALPLIALAVGKLVTGVYVLRYAVPTLLGWSILFAMWLWRETHWSKAATLGSFAFLMVTGFVLPIAGKVGAPTTSMMATPCQNPRRCMMDPRE